MARLLVALAILSIASVGAADPIWSYTVTDLLDGSYAFQSNIDANDGLMEPIWCEMTYSGGLQNTKAFGGIDVHYEPDADTYDPLDPNYHKVSDSWVNEEFSHAQQAQSGGAPGETTFYIDSGNESGVYYLAADHAYMVSTTDVDYSGRIGRHDVWYPVSGTMYIPEPAALLLLAVGGVGLILRRRR